MVTWLHAGGLKVRVTGDPYPRAKNILLACFKGAARGALFSFKWNSPLKQLILDEKLFSELLCRSFGLILFHIYTWLPKVRKNTRWHVVLNLMLALHGFKPYYCMSYPLSAVYGFGLHRSNIMVPPSPHLHHCIKWECIGQERRILDGISLNEKKNTFFLNFDSRWGLAQTRGLVWL